MRAVLAVLWIVAIFVLKSNSQDAIDQPLEPGIQVAVAITSIPPRFPHLHRSLLPWFTDQLYPIHRLCLFIPRSYRRFRRRRGSQEPLSTAALLRSKLLRYPELSRHLERNALRIVEMDRDWGPITKFLGVLQEQTTPNCYANSDFPDFWIFADDDVAYSPFTVQKYLSWWNVLSKQSENLVLTNFSEDYRVFYRFGSGADSTGTGASTGAGITATSVGSVANTDIGTGTASGAGTADAVGAGTGIAGIVVGADGTVVVTDNESTDPSAAGHPEHANIRVVPHVQGVDTYFLSQNNLREQLSHGLLHHVTTTKAVEFFHDTCPESFYQDDYLVSFLFHLSGLRVRSTWTNDNHAVHVEGVSKNHFQMHMAEEVFAREKATKNCIFTFADTVHEIMRQ